MTPDIDRFTSQIETDIQAADLETDTDVEIVIHCLTSGSEVPDVIRFSLTEMVFETGSMRPQLAGELLPLFKDRLKGFAVSLLRSMAKVEKLQIVGVGIEKVDKETS